MPDDADAAGEEDEEDEEDELEIVGETWPEFESERRTEAGRSLPNESLLVSPPERVADVIGGAWTVGNMERGSAEESQQMCAEEKGKTGWKSKTYKQTMS